MILWEVIVEIVSIQKVCCHQQKIPAHDRNLLTSSRLRHLGDHVPVYGALPVEHPVERQVIFPVLAVAYGDDLLEAFYEHGQNQQRQGYGAHVDDHAECADHDEGEDASRPPLTPSAIHAAQNHTQGPSATNILGEKPTSHH